jgi:hypothetical protein
MGKGNSAINRCATARNQFLSRQENPFMLKRTHFTLSILLLALLAATIEAQKTQSIPSPSQSRQVLASASGGAVRFSSLGELIQLRLEVIGSAGELLFDSGFQTGNVMDWSGVDTTGKRLVDGPYLCIVSVKDSSGQITRKQAIASLRNPSLGLQPLDSALLSAAQTQVASEGNAEGAGLMILEPESSSATAIIAHDGVTAHLVSGSGGLAISGGNFFANKVLEHVRLTAEGNLGIGITNPQARLDVAGRIRASEGIVFPDGTVQFSAARKTLGAASQQSGQMPQAQGEAGTQAVDISGTGTTGKISKWTDGPNGVLGDSNITETSGALGINAPPDTRFRLDVNGSVRFRGSNPGFNLEGLRAAGNIWAFQTVDDDGRFRLFGQDNVNPGVERLTINLGTGNVGLGATTPLRHLHVRGASDQEIGIESTDAGGRQWTLLSSRGSNSGRFEIIDRTAAANRFTIQSDGSVGIGTITPTAKLDVIGAINTSTQYNILGQRVFSANNSSTFVGWLAGNTGTGNTFFGSQAGRDISSGTANAFFGDQAGVVNTTGTSNAFFGNFAGGANSSGLSNAFFGRSAGNANTTGNFNTIIGALADVAGSSDLTNATAIGARARVDQSDSLVLGSIQGFNGATASVKVGIGTTTPQRHLHVKGAGDQEIAIESSDTDGRQWTIQSSRGTNFGRFEIIDRTANVSRIAIEGTTGQVGIGTTSPFSTLDVNGTFGVNGNVGGGHVALINNDADTAGADGLEIKIRGGGFLVETNNFITFRHGGVGTAYGAIQANGSGGIELISGAADYAEFLPRLNPAETLQAGELVGLHGGKITRQTQGASKVMAVSSNPIVLGNDPGEKLRDGYEKIAFIGQVMVRVRGKAKAGDFIIASGLNDGTGVAVSPEQITAEQFAQAVGQAWESSADEGVKSVRTAVGLIERDPTMSRLLEAHRKQTAQIAALAARLTAIEARINKESVAYRRVANRKGKRAAKESRVAVGFAR